MAMASSQTDPYQIDRLSALPDALLITILSLLPTHTAARNSVLSCRFRHLWKASPAVDLSIKCLPSFKTLTREARANIYVAMANSALLSRTSFNSLQHLHLEIGSPLPRHLTDSLICSLLVHAHALGLRHLTIDGNCDFEHVLRSVFTISSLESLSIRITPGMAFPSAIALNRLKSLSINLTCNFYNTNIALICNSFQKILSELCCLEDLQLHICSSTWTYLSSRTIKKLELVLVKHGSASLELSMPSLEFLSLKNVGILNNVPLIHGDIPFIRKAVVTLRGLLPKHATAVAQFLNCISHVEALSLDLEEDMFSNYPFSVVMEPGKEVPTFSNLKHLDISICFRECNFEAVVTMLHNCPALESLKLYHKRERGARNAWRSKLPCNSDGNNQYVCFKNLHLGENRNELKKLLNKICTPNRQRVGS